MEDIAGEMEDVVVIADVEDLVDAVKAIIKINVCVTE